MGMQYKGCTENTDSLEPNLISAIITSQFTRGSPVQIILQTQWPVFWKLYLKLLDLENKIMSEVSYVWLYEVPHYCRQQHRNVQNLDSCLFIIRDRGHHIREIKLSIHCTLTNMHRYLQCIYPFWCQIW